MDFKTQNHEAVNFINIYQNLSTFYRDSKQFSGNPKQNLGGNLTSSCILAPVPYWPVVLTIKAL